MTSLVLLSNMMLVAVEEAAETDWLTDWVSATARLRGDFLLITGAEDDNGWLGLSSPSPPPTPPPLTTLPSAHSGQLELLLRAHKQRAGQDFWLFFFWIWTAGLKPVKCHRLIPRTAEQKVPPTARQSCWRSARGKPVWGGGFGPTGRWIVLLVGFLFDAALHGHGTLKFTTP